MVKVMCFVLGGEERDKDKIHVASSAIYATCSNCVAFRLVFWASPAVPACLTMIAAGALQKVVKAMRTHQRHVDTQLYACWALVEICGGDAGWLASALLVLGSSFSVAPGQWEARQMLVIEMCQPLSLCYLWDVQTRRTFGRLRNLRSQTMKRRLTGET